MKAQSSLRTRVFAFVAMVAAASTVACTKQNASVPAQQAAVANVSTQTLEIPAGATRLAKIKAQRHAKMLEQSRGMQLAGQLQPANAQPAVRGDVTFNRSSIFNRVFLYGTDLQYSSIGEAEWSLLYQALALGHVPARFQQVGSRLQLVADLGYRFESNINTPSALIHEWPILKEDTDTVTVSIQTASPTLVTVLGGPQSPAARTSWVRSVEFVTQGDYLLIETSVELADGSLAEFMESVFPRETLVPASAKPLLADAALEPLAGRFRFLAGETFFLDLPQGRVRTQVASRFPVPAQGQFIDWYITPNVPAEFLPIIKAGVEGWNRYSQKSMGRDIVRFAGVMPAGMKIGDPRYNIINWDSVPMAGAAYESQAVDPFTGLQSHSLVYLPYAWVTIGQEYWKRGGYSEASHAHHTAKLNDVMNKTSFIGQKLKKTCFHELELAASLSARTTPEAFAKELLKGVLFHEIGHAMGLAHNFKGSLSWNPNDPAAPVTTSIMDYNQYQIEAGAFESETSASGPLLEYDRQIMSALYNGFSDITQADPIVPACDDSEADDYNGGVDPLCIRYDAGEDPTVQLHRTIELTRNPAAKVGPTLSLPQAILETRTSLGDAATIKTEAEVDAKIAALANDVLGVTSFYFVSGAQSLSYMARANMKSFYIAKAGVVPAPYDTNAMADRALKGLQYVVGLGSMEPAVVASIAQVKADAGAWVKSTGWYSELVVDNKDTKAAEKLKALGALQSTMEQALLPRLRQSLFASIANVPTVPFLFSLDMTPAVDFEQAMIEILVAPLTQPTIGAGTQRPIAERMAAATQLKTFAQAPGFAAAQSAAVATIQQELAQVRTAEKRHQLRALLTAVRGF